MDQENHTRDNYDTSSDKMRKRPPVRYDENGNPIRPKKRPPVRYDENGNPIRPKRPPVRYDENGNPIRPKRPPVRYDENGNPIRPKRPPVRYDENGNPIRTGRSTSAADMGQTGGYAKFKENEAQIFDRGAYEQESKQMRESKRKKKSKNIFGKILVALQALLTIAFMVLVFILDLLPTRYVIAIGAILAVMWIFTLLSQKFKAGRVVGKVYALIVILILSVGVTYIWKANNVIADLTTGQLLRVSNMSVIVMQDSPANDLMDLDGATFGIQETLDQAGTQTSIQNLQSNYTQGVNTQAYSGFVAQVQALYSGEVDAIIMNEAYRDMVKEQYANFDTETRVLDSFTYEEEIASAPSSTVDVVQEPFTIFISGNDSYGEVMLDDGRSDVNILATVNPQTKQILLTTTPRDYYIELAPSTFGPGVWDKLTHAGIYGIDASMDTLEYLYDIDIDYYVRVNFSGFESIVDALGGVEVYSDYTFTSYHGNYTFTEGYNYVNGDQALGFVRERYAFSDGDVQRGRNQMAMINAIINKATSPAILTNYMSLMDSLSDFFITDMPRDQISDLVKMQLDEGGSWNIVSNSVAGVGGMDYTYSGGEASVMYQVDSAVEQAKMLISQCENGQVLTDPNT